ncbi:cold shock domain-containing protein [Streptomyces sp. NPDC059398]|uniref:cold shock domain-containing protein n=1 Tax=Streptomyces sp. NPDC059398 TaxID=3346820 RepID=UPI00368EA135
MDVGRRRHLGARVHRPGGLAQERTPSRLGKPGVQWATSVHTPFLIKLAEIPDYPESDRSWTTCAEKGFGFITPDDGSADVFAHCSAIDSDRLRALNESSKVSFETTQGPRSPRPPTSPSCDQPEAIRGTMLGPGPPDSSMRFHGSGRH